ncbi:hypothetical protein R0J90_16425, partial [Micrococcus sp. SIMBA_144]
SHDSGRALKELDAKPVLQGLHCAGYSRTRYAQGLSRAGEVPAFYDLYEHIHLLNSIHADCSPFPSNDVKIDLII